jgi:hypothetical protein
MMWITQRAPHLTLFDSQISTSTNHMVLTTLPLDASVPEYKTKPYVNNHKTSRDHPTLASIYAPLTYARGKYREGACWSYSTVHGTRSSEKPSSLQKKCKTGGLREQH